MEKCHICFENCIIPLQLKCFECNNDMKMNCNSLQRVCMLCYMKSNLQKCSFCRAPKVNDNISIDFLMMEQDGISRYTCPFCNTFEGNHVDLYTHMMRECITRCECGKFYTKQTENHHFKQECKVWKWCCKCKNKVENCIHFPCEKCGKVCHSDVSCKETLVKCPECKEELNSKDLLPHVLEHIEESKKRIHLMKDVLRTERKRYHDMMEIVPNLYKNVYDEALF